MKYRSYQKAISVLLVSALLLFAAAPCAFAAQALLGDLTGDGRVTAADARDALRLAVKLEPLTPDRLILGDVTGDGKVTAADARILLRVAVKLDSLNGRTVEISAPTYAELLAALPTEIPAPPEISPPSDSFTFITYGWGHCVGLSQYGAILMSQAGIPDDYILSYYFPGTRIAVAETYPETTYYAGSTVNTEELLCSIVSMEIGGSQPPADALKAQAVAVFTLMKYYNFHVDVRYTVGYAAKYENCSDRLKNAVHEVIGMYLVQEDDPDETPVLTVYGAMAAGRTLACKDVWGGDYPVSVPTPFEASLPEFSHVYTMTSAEVKNALLAGVPGVSLSEDPAEWLEITQHDASVDADRGYVSEVRVGDRTVSGVGAFSSMMGLRSPCFTVTYTP